MAGQIRRALELDVTPFPVDTAVERLGGRIEVSASPEAEALVKKEGDSFVIALAAQPETRRRFSVAHELGHLFLHMGYLIEPEKWAAIDEYRDAPKYRYGFSEEEYEAHEFAAALLMPAEAFRARVAALSKGDRTPLRPIAEEFQVSLDAARVRGQWLGLFEWPR